MKIKNLVFSIIGIVLTSVMLHAQQLTSISSGLLHPESVTTDGKFLYTSCIGKELKGMEKDGDGAISKLTLEGKLVEATFSKEVFNAPKGLSILNNILYVTDIDRIVGLDLQSGKKVTEIDFSSYAPLSLNDITIKNASSLFVGATDIGKVFQVDLKSNKITPLEPSVKGANGLCYDAKTNQLFVVGVVFGEKAEGEIGVIDWKEGRAKYTVLVELKGYFDGVEMLDQNTLLVSDWYLLKELKGRLLEVNIKNKTVKEIQRDIDAADFYVNIKKDNVLIPGLVSGNIYQLHLKH